MAAALEATVGRFVGDLKMAVDASIAECATELSPSPYSTESPRLFLIDSLAEGADQVVAKAVTSSELGFRLRAPIAFDVDTYKGFFSVDEQASTATFEDLTRDPNNGTVIVELHLPTAERASAYSAAKR